uniref:Ig-like domain-containing protein n=1 Tax=Xiphophorus maculatus TaxID=8083 RepID=A0A3B5RCZ5_XIPMA
MHGFLLTLFTVILFSFFFHYFWYFCLTPTPKGLKVRQYPQSLTVTVGEMATLSCHFNFKSLKSGVQWFKMKPGKQLIPKSLKRIFVEKNQTSSLVITEVTLEDCGWYFCEVNVLQKDPKLGNGTKLLFLGEKQIVCFRNEHGRNLLGLPLTLSQLVWMERFCRHKQNKLSKSDA